MKRLISLISLIAIPLVLFLFYQYCNAATILIPGPDNPRSMAGPGYIDIAWNPVNSPDVIGYQIYKRTAGTSYDENTFVFTTQPSYTDTQVTYGNTYYYGIKTLFSDGSGGTYLSDVYSETGSMYIDSTVKTYTDAVKGKPTAFSSAPTVAVVADINGDGKKDLILGFPQENKVRIYLDCNTNTVPSITLSGEATGDQFGYSIAAADLNNDGYDDLIIGAPYASTGSAPNIASEAGKVYVYQGGRKFSSTPTLVIQGEAAYDGNGVQYTSSERLGTSIAAVGDVTGTGYQDVAIGAPQGGVERSGRVLVLLGGATIADRTTEIPGSAPMKYFGQSVASAGDVNGDGLKDIVVGAANCSETPVPDGEADLIYGGTTLALSNVVLSGPNCYGSVVAGLDMNGDGYSDIAVGSKNSPYAADVYYGGPSISTQPSISFPVREGLLLPLGDINGDGFADLLTGNLTVDYGNTVFDNTPDIQRADDGKTVIGTGDVNDDGIQEILTYSSGYVYASSFGPYTSLPKIAVSSIQDDATVMYFRTQTVAGTISGDVSSLLIAGSSATVSPDGNFSKQISLNDGLNTFEVLAETSDGQVSKKIINVNFVPPPPLTVQITSPADGSILTSSPIVVTGTVSDPSATVYVDGVLATVSSGSFQATVNLVEGQNGIDTSATDQYGQSAEDIVTVQLSYPTPTTSLTASPSSINAGDSAVLSWTSTDADSCSISPGLGSVSLSGSVSVSPAQTTTYTITATGPGGTATSSATVTVTNPTPTVSLTASPQTIPAGQSATLTWSSANADNVSIDQGIGNVAASGSLTVTPTQTTTYTITATGPGGTATSGASVTVTYPAPTATISISPQTIAAGQSATLTWSSTNASTAVIDQGIGDVGASGSTTVSPSGDTTYTITVTGPGGTASASAAVTVSPAAATVNGTLTDASTSQPIAGATVTATDSTKTQSVQTGSTGGYEIDNVTPGTVTFTFSKDGYQQDSTSITVSQNETVVLNATLTPVPTSATLEGVVTLASTGQPVSGATVTVQDSTRTQSTQTDSTGGYTIGGIVPGTVQVSVSYGSMFQTAQYTFATASTYSQNFSMGGCATFTGTVTDAATGAAIAGATVSVTDATGAHTAQAASDGTYTIAGISLEAVSITASAAGYGPQTGTVTPAAAQTYTVDISLYDVNSTATVQGVITNAKTLLPEPGVSVTLQGTQTSAVTDANGAFTLLDVPFGNQSFHVEKDGFVNVLESSYIDTTPYGLDLIEPIVAGAANPSQIGTSTSGFVTDAVTGAVLQGATVTVFGTDIRTTTASDGSYTLSGLPLGAIQIVAEDLDHEAESMDLTVASGGSGGCTFALPPMTSATITGTVTDASTGQPIRYATVNVGDAGLLTASTEADGTFTITGVPAGTYTVKAQGLEYLAASTSEVSVTDGGSASVNFTLTQRPVTGSLQGTIVDDQTNAAIAGAVLTVTDNGATATTDQSGAFSLAGLPAGLVTISISAAGYPTTTRTTRVMADQDASTPTVTTVAFQLDATDPAPPNSSTKIITAAQGGSIETPDGRFTLVIPPNVLSADASVTLQNPVSGPPVTPGAALTMDPALGVSNIVALGNPTELDIAPSVAGGPTPTLSGWVLILGQYSQSQADSSAVAEDTAYPYYWDGQEWTALQTKPLEAGADPVNNLTWAAVDLSTTETGNPTGLSSIGNAVLDSTTKTANSTDSSSIDKIIFEDGAFLASFVITPPTNVQITDANGLKAANSPATSYNSPNPNALPLVVIEGWDAKQILTDDWAGTDPNKDTRYSKILQDLVNSTDGVYRPIFVSYNSRAGIGDSGAAIASKLDPMLGQSGSIRGLPASDSTNNGAFPYVDTFGFSMGGLVSRTYQANSGMVHNMVIAGTPNHGAFGILNEFLPLWAITEPFKLHSPGTADLLGYDDRMPCWMCGNKTLCELNNNPLSIPQKNMTLIAGTGGPYILYGDYNDWVVPVSSVFCTKTGTPEQYQDDATKSLFPQQHIGKTYTFPFTHIGFGVTYWILDPNGGSTALQTAILTGLSDWAVPKEYQNPGDSYSDNDFSAPTADADGYARSCIRVDYNCQDKDFDRVVLVLYAKDASGNWRIVAGDGVSTNGDVSGAHAVSGTSDILDPSKPQPVTLTASCTFDKVNAGDPSTDIQAVQPQMIMLKLGQTTVPTKPDQANLAIPQQ